MKYKIITVAILAAYFAFSIATTKKDILLPMCLVESDIHGYLFNTGGQKYRNLDYFTDTLMLTYSDTVGVKIESITDSICRMGLQKCNLPKLTIAIRDTTYDPAGFNSPYGKIILTKECR